jgi:hypothetical protein
MAGKYLRHMAAHIISMMGRGIPSVAGDECQNAMLFID